MATAASVDVLSADDRKIVLAALELQAASFQRAARTAKSAAIADAVTVEYNKVQALMTKFR